tara:strand:+ start:200 stop:1039 length:840 start_codon:yes stop_codon:yes gene_type:complete
MTRSSATKFQSVDDEEAAFSHAWGSGGARVEVGGKVFVVITEEQLRVERKRAREGGLSTGMKAGRREGRAAQVKTEERRSLKRQDVRQDRAARVAERSVLAEASESRKAPVSLVRSLKSYLKAHPEQLEQVTLAVIHRARQGDARMIEMIFNRIDGAVIQKQQTDQVVHVKRYGFADPGSTGPVLDVAGGPVVDDVEIEGPVEDSEVAAPALALDEALDEHGELVWAPKVVPKRSAAAENRLERARESALAGGVSVEAEATVDGLSDTDLQNILGDLET